MRHPRLLGIAGLAIAAVAAVAFAQSTVTPLPEQAPAPVAPLGDPVADLAKTLADNEEKITGELIEVQGSPADIGGYYRPDDAKASKVMRPSATLNEAIDNL